jgi:TonB family protein
MNRLIGQHWARPEVKPGTAVKISFAINRDGSIRDAAIEMPSGNSLFDRAAQRAILETSPLPPLPFAYSGTYLAVHLIFK